MTTLHYNKTDDNIVFAIQLTKDFSFYDQNYVDFYKERL